MQLTLETQKEGEIPVLQCRGRIVYRDEASTLTEKAYELLQAHSRLLLDLDGVENIDSGGLGALVMLQMWARHRGCDLKFCSPGRQVRELFALTNLQSVFELYSTREQACRVFSQSAMQSVF